MYKRIMAIVLVLTTVVSSSILGYASGNVGVYYIDSINEFELVDEDFSVVYFTHEVMFDYMEDNGIPIRTLLPEDVLASAERKDMMRSGDNRIERIYDEDGEEIRVDIYMSTEMLRALELGGITAALLLNYIPAIGMFVSVVTQYFVSEGIDASRAIILECEKVVVEKGDEWGITYEVTGKRYQ